VAVQLEGSLLFCFSQHSQTQMLNLKARWERATGTEMDSKRRKTLHKNSGISGRKKILRFDTFILGSIAFFFYCETIS
jgi:hypothetical protein